jgi:Cutinase/PKD domain
MERSERQPLVGRFDFLLAVLGVLAVVCLAGSAIASNASAACPPYEVIGARGSGQAKKRDEKNMGPEIYSFYYALRGLLGTGVVKGYGLQYPAVGAKSPAGIAAFLHLPGSYTDSVREGAAEVLQQIEVRRHTGCGSTKFILAGYSQGAQVIGDALRKEEVRKAVAAVALFGDPYFNADSSSARGGFDSSLYGIFGPRSEWPSSLSGRIFSYCHWHDVICNMSSRRHIWGTNQDVYVRTPLGETHPHETYATGGDTGSAARDVARALGFTPSPLPYSGPLDIAFAIDSTGSMFDEIEEVKENVTSLVGQIAAIDPDYQLSLVDYKDVEEEESEYQSHLDIGFTRDIAAFNRELEELEAYGGGDDPESVYSGLMTALGQDWRAGAKKIVVQIGDAPAKDPEPLTGYTLRSVQTKALSVDPAAIDAIQSGDEPDAASSFSAIASATGGQYLQLPEGDLSGLVPAIANEIRRNTTAPAATLTAPSRVVAGVPISLSAAASHDVGEAIAGYDWDFDGDGSFDETTIAPIAAHVYPTTASLTAVVRVRSTSGLSSLATAPIVVAAPATKRPRKPRHLRATMHGGRVILSWRAGRGRLPQWFTVLDSHGHAVARIAVARKGREFSATMPGLRRNGRYRFSVTAGSEAGESRRAGPVTAVERRYPQSGHHRHQTMQHP